ncbi:MAG: hypothetical protein H6Q74_2546 [Firmicutes bacterium]|nr:hypothetical protein [Bacillota bacterium]
MKRFFKVTLAILSVIILIAAGGVFYLTRGLKEGSTVVISGIDVSAFPDGTYTGKYDNRRWSNELSLTVKNGKITNIAIVKDVEYSNKGMSDTLFQRVLTKQNTTVDVVSEATVTSKAYLKAIENAFAANPEGKK